MQQSKRKHCERETIRLVGGRQYELSQFAQMYGLTYDHAREILAAAGESRDKAEHLAEQVA